MQLNEYLEERNPEEGLGKCQREGNKFYCLGAILLCRGLVQIAMWMSSPVNSTASIAEEGQEYSIVMFC